MPTVQHPLSRVSFARKIERGDLREQNQEYAAQDVKYLVKAYRAMHAAMLSKNLVAQAS